MSNVTIGRLFDASRNEAVCIALKVYIPAAPSPRLVLPLVSIVGGAYPAVRVCIRRTREKISHGFSLSGRGPN